MFFLKRHFTVISKNFSLQAEVFFLLLLILLYHILHVDIPLHLFQSFCNSNSLRSLRGTASITRTCSSVSRYHFASRALFVTAWLKSCSAPVYFSIALWFPPAALTANFPALSSSSTSSVMDQREEWLAITSALCRGSLRLLFPRNVFTNNFWWRPKWV